MKKVITKKEALAKLRKLIGKNLRELAEQYNVTVFKNGKPNKGWAGHTLEIYLGLGLNSVQAPNGEYWELKSFPFKYAADCKTLKPKETFAITMINSEQVASTDFYDSHLWAKLKSFILCGRLFVDKEESSSKLLSVDSLDFEDDKKLIKIIEEDYNIVRNTIINKGFDHLTGKMGTFIQPRTKGPGHGSTSRAFYARTSFIKEVLDL